MACLASGAPTLSPAHPRCAAAGMPMVCRPVRILLTSLHVGQWHHGMVVCVCCKQIYNGREQGQGATERLAALYWKQRGRRRQGQQANSGNQWPLKRSSWHL